MNYGEFAERLWKKLENRRIPVSGTVELTIRCNLSCAHCYINQAQDDAVALQRELSTDAWMQIIDAMVEQGCLWLLLTGGEPLLRPDFLDIYLHAKKRGLLVTLFSNGTLITPRIARALAKYRPFSVDITIYGHTKQTYESVTKVSGSFEACRRGIQLLKEHRVPLGLKSMIMTLNEHEVWAMKKWAAAQDLRFSYDAVINSRVDGSSVPGCGVRIPPRRVVELDMADEQRLKEWRRLLTHCQAPPDPEHIYQCGAGTSAFHIDPYGELSACIIARSPSYSLVEGTFAAGWHDFLARVRAQKRKQDSPCARCNLLLLCNHCPGWAMLENGQPEGPVEYLCQIAHLRAKRFGLINENQDEGRSAHESQKSLS
jgi:radical SAM protein with 4Fe4S-binding SPASM domain